jgi:hypothetical protein
MDCMKGGGGGVDTQGETRCARKSLFANLEVRDHLEDLAINVPASNYSPYHTGEVPL